MLEGVIIDLIAPSFGSLFWRELLHQIYSKNAIKYLFSINVRKILFSFQMGLFCFFCIVALLSAIIVNRQFPIKPIIGKTEYIPNPCHCHTACFFTSRFSHIEDICGHHHIYLILKKNGWWLLFMDNTR